MRPTLLGPDAEPTLLDQDIDTLLLAHPRPTQGDLIDFLKLYLKGGARNFAAQRLIARGLTPKLVGDALSAADMSTTLTTTIFTKRNVMGFLVVASAALSAFHGYRRNQSVPWALGWFMAGMIFPVVTPTIAFAQGFGQRKGA